jgi:hypothetical protein
MYAILEAFLQKSLGHWIKQARQNEKNRTRRS